MKSPEEISETLNARKSTKEDYQTYINNAKAWTKEHAME